MTPRPPSAAAGGIRSAWSSRRCRSRHLPRSRSLSRRGPSYCAGAAERFAAGVNGGIREEASYLRDGAAAAAAFFLPMLRWTALTAPRDPRVSTLLADDRRRKDAR